MASILYVLQNNKLSCLNAEIVYPTSCPQCSILSAVQSNNYRILDVMLKGPTHQEELDRALFLACRNGLINCAQRLIEGGADVNATDVSGNTPLYLSVKECQPEVTTLLCNNGSKVNCRGSSNNTALHVAAMWGRNDCLDILLRHGCKINSQDSSGSTGLILAVKNKQYYALQRLLEEGCDVNVQDKAGRTALHYGCHMAVAVEKLIQAGSQVNIQDKEGCTPLLLAASEGLPNVVQALCQVSDLDVNLANFGAQKTPLHLLAYKGHTRSVGDLLAAGADSTLLDKDQKSALWYAVTNGKRDVAALMLQCTGLIQHFQCPPEHPELNCPVLQSITKGHVDILKLFIVSGFDNGHLKEALSRPEVRSMFEENQISHWLHAGCEVLTLRQLCRASLRHHLNDHLCSGLPELPIPPRLQDYLSLKELEDV